MQKFVGKNTGPLWNRGMALTRGSRYLLFLPTPAEIPVNADQT